MVTVVLSFSDVYTVVATAKVVGLGLLRLF